jgi:hypothetical protein
MSRWIAAAVVVLVGWVPAHAGEPKGKLVLDLWDAVYLEGGKAGAVHTTVHELDLSGRKILRSTVDFQLHVKKNNQVIQLRAQTGTDETPEGKVVATYMRQKVGKEKDLTITGTVKGKEIELLLDGRQQLKPAPWNDSALGLYRQQMVMADKKAKTGDKFTFLSFEPTVNVQVEMAVTVMGYEEVEVLGSRSKVKLLRVEIVPEKLEGVKLPTLVLWVSADLKPVRQETEIPGLGKITLYRTTRDIALAPGPEATLTDVGISNNIRLNKKVAKPYDTTSAVYRISVKGEDDPGSTFAADARQKILNAKGTTFELHVIAGKGPKKGQPAAKVGDEFLESTYFINSADDRVKAHARKAVGKETDPWRKALLIEKWVNLNMRPSNNEALSPADEVARTMEGDCTEYAMLMAAMCRAEGVPSRTAIGLLYADVKNNPVLAFHMWTEVWVDNQWVALDATLGRGYVGATHLKVTDSSWQGPRSLAPLMPLLRVLGKTQVEIVNVQ